MRKLIQLSPSTHVVSIPSKWLKRNNLNKGDEVDVIELENQLVINTNKERKISSIKIDLRNLPRKLVWAKCDAAYIAGHDEIKFLFKAEQKEILDFVSTEVPGMIITEQKPDSITFKDITAGKVENIQSIITRILHMISDMINEAIGYFQDSKWSSIKEIKKRDYVLNSYISYAQRQINRYGFEKNYSSNLIVTFLKLCETFADSICLICAEYAKNKTNISKELSNLLETWRMLTSLFLNYKEAQLAKFEISRKDLTPKFEPLKSALFDIIEVIIQLNS